MGAIRNFKPSFFSTQSKVDPDSESTLAVDPAAGQDATMATVMMTQLNDTKLQVKFHRLMMMSEGNKVLRAYPLNRKVTHVGRSRRNHVKITDPLVSIRHLSVSVSGSSCVVNDLGSSNGTFINGERLVGGHVLKDGDEIMIGKTILRFAARQANAPLLPDRPHKQSIRSLLKKRYMLLTAAALFLVASVALVMHTTRTPSEILTAEGKSQTENTRDASPRASDDNIPATHPSTQNKAKTEPAKRQAPPKQETSHIQRALAEYAKGQLNRAIQTLKMVSAAKAETPEAFRARSLLSMINTVQGLYVQALEAEKQKRFAKTIECWDRLLTVDMELVGDRPSFFAAQAEQKVQSLSYAHALEAYREKNHDKARQLCQFILQINPKNPQALALQAKIDKKA